jgi:two-component system cell cycle sensor histidine kinase/response regulator CckA
MTTKQIARPHVIVVDDEPAVRSLVRRMLEPAGYIVDEAVDALEACAAAEKNDHLDLLVSDFRMPDLTGGEVARRIRATKPNVKVLFVTGYADDLFDEQQALWEGESFLEKPFSKRGLLEAASLLLFGKLNQEQLFEPTERETLGRPRSWGFRQEVPTGLNLH